MDEGGKGERRGDGGWGEKEGGRWSGFSSKRDAAGGRGIALEFGFCWLLRFKSTHVDRRIDCSRMECFVFLSFDTRWVEEG